MLRKQNRSDHPPRPSLKRDYVIIGARERRF
jgi:hypothetical protein